MRKFQTLAFYFTIMNNHSGTCGLLTRYSMQQSKLEQSAIKLEGYNITIKCDYKIPLLHTIINV